jgi:hypothetical protein
VLQFSLLLLLMLAGILNAAMIRGIIVYVIYDIISNRESLLRLLQVKVVLRCCVQQRCSIPRASADICCRRPAPNASSRVAAAAAATV